GAAPGQGPGPDRRKAGRDLQRAPRALALNRNLRRVRRGSPLPRLAASLVPAPDHSNQLALGLRRLGPLAEAIGRRLHLSCGSSRREVVRYLSGQCQRSRGPAPFSVLPEWPYPGHDGGATAGTASRLTADPRPAPAAP